MLFAAALFVAVLGPGVMGLDTSRAADNDELEDLRGAMCARTPPRRHYVPVTMNQRRFLDRCWKM